MVDSTQMGGLCLLVSISQYDGKSCVFLSYFMALNLAVLLYRMALSLVIAVGGLFLTKILLIYKYLIFKKS